MSMISMVKEISIQKVKIANAIEDTMTHQVAVDNLYHLMGLETNTRSLIFKTCRNISGY